ncbi:hypothetical protein [Bradyrhizobium yuanmingense]|uniref:hypothetical protein n=1 Tax=Bradyrhizobium yuanmingense TaxID=108015 RepID=UPI0035170AB5
MNDLSETFRSIANAASGLSPIIFVLYKGSEPPPFAAPMPRIPPGPVEQVVDLWFTEVIRQAYKDNPALHDGAIMVKKTSAGQLIVKGWSFRLFPPEAPTESTVNRGSAFNSCHAMSFISEVDCVFLLSNGECFQFQNGRINPMASVDPIGG